MQQEDGEKTKKEWRYGWTSTQYVSGRWQSVTEIREFEDGSDLSDLVCVVTTDRARRIMDSEVELLKVAAERDEWERSFRLASDEACTAAAERDAARAEVGVVTANAVETLMGACTADDNHGVDQMSFSMFVTTEGVRCSLCIAAERDAARQEVERLLDLLARTSSYLDYMEERGYSSVRVIRSEVAQTLRAAGYEEKASYWTRPGESQP